MSDDEGHKKWCCVDAANCNDMAIQYTNEGDILIFYGNEQYEYHLLFCPFCGKKWEVS